MKTEKLFNRNRVHFIAVLLCSVFLFAGCGGNDDGGGSVLMSSVGQSGADIVAHSAQAGGASLAAPNAQQAQDRVAAKNADKNTIFLSKTSDEIMFASSPAVYDLSQITVIAPNPAGKPIDRTDYPHTEWTLVSGLGALTGTVYSTAVPETAVFRAIYSHGGDINTADFILRVVGLATLAISKTSDSLSMTSAGPNVYDLSSITVNAVYTNGVSKDVTNDPATVWTLVSGDGTLNGKIYSTAVAPSAAVFAVSYAEYGIVKTAQFDLAVIDMIQPAVTLSDNHVDAVVCNGDVLVITATFTENDKMSEAPAPAITIGSIVANAPMSRINDFCWIYTWSVLTDKSGTQEVSVTAFDRSGNRNTPAAGKTAYLIQNEPSQYVYAGQWTGITYTSGVAVDNSGNVYATSQDHSVRKFAPGGALIKKWGSYGKGNGQFCYPGGIALDPSGNIYVADEYNSRIQKFDSDGNFLLKWGSLGSGAGQFNRQFDVATDNLGFVYVADRMNHRIQKFDSNGTFLFKFGGYGTANGQLNQPLGVKVDASGNIYVADSFNQRIQKFDSNGNYILKWGSSGSGDGQFNCASNVALDSAGNVFISDHFNNRIQKFDSNGKFITKFGISGLGDGQVNQPYGIALDFAGNVYVADCFNHRIQKFTLRY